MQTFTVTLNDSTLPPSRRERDIPADVMRVVDGELVLTDENDTRIVFHAACGMWKCCELNRDPVKAS